MATDGREIGPNDAFRFLLELAALGAFGYWGWTTHAGAARWAWTLGPPLFALVVWGVFRVDGDPGPAPVPVPGLTRLLLEATLFVAAAVLLASAAGAAVGLLLAGLVVAHYALAWRRLWWLLGRG